MGTSPDHWTSLDEVYKAYKLARLMNVIYTLHAEEQIRERKILKVWVEEAIKSPDVARHIGHKFYATKKLNGNTIKVIYVKENYIKVITSYFVK